MLGLALELTDYLRSVALKYHSLFEDIVIVIVGDLAITATKLNEQQLMSAELCRQCYILNLLSLD